MPNVTEIWANGPNVVQVDNNIEVTNNLQVNITVNYRPLGVQLTRTVQIDVGDTRILNWDTPVPDPANPQAPPQIPPQVNAWYNEHLEA